MRPGIYAVEYLTQSSYTKNLIGYEDEGFESTDHVIAADAQYAIDKAQKHAISSKHSDDTGKLYPITKFTLVSVKMDQQAEY